MRRVVVVALVAVLLVLTGSGGAGAHAYLEASNPADGSSVAAAPRTLRLSFSEHVVLGATRITLTDSAGHEVVPSHLHLATTDPTDTEVPSTVVGTLPALARGTWRVSWETLSSDDLHRTAGFLVFGIDTAVTAAAFHESPPAPLDAALDVMLLLGLALTLGGLLAARVVARVPGEAAPAARALVVRLARGGLVLALVASVVQPITQVRGGGVGLAELARSSYGLRWSVREAGLAILVGAVWSLGAAGGRRRGTRWLAGVGVALTATGTALLGHAATTAQAHPDRVLVTGAHLVAALTWAGAVGCLALVLAVPRLSGRLPVPPVRVALRAFGPPAATCVAVVVVTGIYLTSVSAGSVDAVLRTIYGQTLLVKLLLAAVAGGLGLVNHRLLRGPRDLGVPSRTLLLEASAVALVLVATGVLVSAQPATEPELVATGPAPTAGPISRQVADLQQSVEISPNRPGAVVVSVTVFDTRRPSPGPVTEVLLGVGPGPLVPAGPLGDGRWAATLPHLRPGTADVHVAVHRAGAPTVTSTVTWTVGGATVVPTIVSRRPLRRPLALLAGGTAALLLVVAGGVLVRERRRRRASDAPADLDVERPSRAGSAA